MNRTFSTSLALLLFAGPTAAHVPSPADNMVGGEFYEVCTKPPAGHELQARMACQNYVATIGIGLAAQGRMCPGMAKAPPRLLAASLYWIDAHRAYKGRPAQVQISNGLAADFPCRMPPRRRRTPQEAATNLKALVDIVGVLKALAVMLG